MAKIAYYDQRIELTGAELTSDIIERCTESRNLAAGRKLFCDKRGVEIRLAVSLQA